MPISFIRFRLLLLCSLCAILAGLMHLQCFAAPKISESDARGRALAALKAVGVPNQGLTQAAVSSLPGMPDDWHLSDKDVSVRVNGDTGQIKTIMNWNAVHTRASKPNALTQDRANQLAEDYLRKLGLWDPSPKLISSKAMSDSAASGLNYWAVSYQRTYQGYPFHYDFVSVTLALKDGGLESVGGNVASPLPASMKLATTRDAAVQAGKVCMQKHRPELGELKSAELLIVQPDQYWDYVGTGQTPPRPTTSRLAWVVRFRGRMGISEAWVDAENGAVIGGVKSR